MNSMWNGYLKPMARTIWPMLLGIVGVTVLYSLIMQAVWLIDIDDSHWDDVVEFLTMLGALILGPGLVGITILTLLTDASAKEISVAFPTHLFFLPRKSSQIVFPVLAFKAVSFTLCVVVIWGITGLFPESFPVFNEGSYKEIRETTPLWLITLYILSTYLFLQSLIWAVPWWGVVNSLVVFCGFCLLAQEMGPLFWPICVCGGILISYASVHGMRRGKRWRWGQCIQWVQAGSYYEIIRIESPVKAQAWFEWRRGLWKLPVLCLLLVMLIYAFQSISNSGFKGFSVAVLLYIPVTIAFGLGYFMDRPSKLYEEFCAIRPMCSSRLAAGRILAGCVSAGIGTLIIGTAYLPYVHYPDLTHLNHREHGNFRGHEYIVAKLNGIDLDARFQRYKSDQELIKKDARVSATTDTALNGRPQAPLGVNRNSGSSGRSSGFRLVSPGHSIQNMLSGKELAAMEFTHFLFLILLYPLFIFSIMLFALLAGRFLMILFGGMALGTLAAALLMMATGGNMALTCLSFIVLGAVILLANRKNYAFLKLRTQSPRWRILTLILYSVVLGVLSLAIQLYTTQGVNVLFNCFVVTLLSIGTLIHLNIGSRKLILPYVIVQLGIFIVGSSLVVLSNEVNTNMGYFSSLFMIFTIMPAVLLITPSVIEWQRRA